MIKSYLKYTGSKARVLDQILPYIGKPKTFVEPFMGSGTVSLNVESENYILSDINKDVINCHNCVISHVGGVSASLKNIDAQSPDNILERKEYYYQVRSSFNSINQVADYERAAQFIWMNKNGFNGLIRYNKSNEFNVAFGSSISGNKPEIPREDILNFRNVFLNRNKYYISTLSYRKALDNLIRENTDYDGMVIYIDPPYVKSETSYSDALKYTDVGFTYDDHIRLVMYAKYFISKGVRVLISNHKTADTLHLYRDAKEIVDISAYRSVSRKSNTRGDAKEILAIYE